MASVSSLAVSLEVRWKRGLATDQVGKELVDVRAAREHRVQRGEGCGRLRGFVRRQRAHGRSLVGEDPGADRLLADQREVDRLAAAAAFADGDGLVRRDD